MVANLLDRTSPTTPVTPSTLDATSNPTSAQTAALSGDTTGNATSSEINITGTDTTHNDGSAAHNIDNESTSETPAPKLPITEGLRTSAPASNGTAGRPTVLNQNEAPNIALERAEHEKSEPSADDKDASPTEEGEATAEVEARGGDPEKRVDGNEDADEEGAAGIEGRGVSGDGMSTPPADPVFGVVVPDIIPPPDYPNPFLLPQGHPEAPYVTQTVEFVERVVMEKDAELPKLKLEDLRIDVEDMVNAWAGFDRAMGYPEAKVSGHSIAYWNNITHVFAGQRTQTRHRLPPGTSWMVDKSRSSVRKTARNIERSRVWCRGS